MIDTRKGDQFAPDFLALDTTVKVALLVDDAEVSFGSNTVLLFYVAEKSGRFLLSSGRDRALLLCWLTFVTTGIGPYSGELPVARA